MENTVAARRKVEEIAYYVDHNVTKIAGKLSGQRKYDNVNWCPQQATKCGHRYSKDCTTKN